MFINSLIIRLPSLIVVHVSKTDPNARRVHEDIRSCICLPPYSACAVISAAYSISKHKNPASIQLCRYAAGFLGLSRLLVLCLYCSLRCNFPYHGLAAPSDSRHAYLHSGNPRLYWLWQFALLSALLCCSLLAVRSVTIPATSLSRLMYAVTDISYIRNSAAALKALASTPAFQRHSNEHTGPTPTSSGYNTYDSVSSCWTASIGHVDERTDICRASSSSQTYGKYNSSCSEFRPHVVDGVSVELANNNDEYSGSKPASRTTVSDTTTSTRTASASPTARRRGTRAPASGITAPGCSGMRRARNWATIPTSTT